VSKRESSSCNLMEQDGSFNFFNDCRGWASIPEKDSEMTKGRDSLFQRKRIHQSRIRSCNPFTSDAGLRGGIQYDLHAPHESQPKAWTSSMYRSEVTSHAQQKTADDDGSERSWSYPNTSLFTTRNHDRGFFDELPRALSFFTWHLFYACLRHFKKQRSVKRIQKGVSGTQ
jgi:hypothetical protein